MEKSVMEYSEKLFKTKLLEALHFTVDFLNCHKLRWFVGQGTCIGAIRHHGLIPWDDDIDLLMPREDYDKLVRLRDKMEGTGYELISWKTNDTMIPFAKVVNRNTTIWEIKYHPYVSGVFIDIFPMELSAKCLDEIKDDLDSYNKTLRKYRSAMTFYSLNDIFQLGFHRRFYFFREGVQSFFTRPYKNEYLAKLQEIEKNNNSKEGKHFVLFSACFVYAYEKEIFKREWFDDYIMMPFEDIEVRVPVGFDAYLTHVYGDYMKLPPLEKRVTRHYHYYVNLLEGKTIEEIKQIKMKEGGREMLP